MLSKKGIVVCGLSSQRGGRGLVRGSHVSLGAYEASLSMVYQWCIRPTVIGEFAVVTS